MPRTTYDDRDYLVPRMAAYEARELKALAREQITHVDLSSYQPGHPHYEALMASMDKQQQAGRLSGEVNV